MDPVEHDTDFVWKQSSGGRIPFWPLFKWGGLAAAVAFVVWQLVPSAVPAISNFAEAFFQDRAVTGTAETAPAEPVPVAAEAVPQSEVDAPLGAAATPWAEVPDNGSGETDAASETLAGEPSPKAASPIREVEPDGDAAGRDSFSAEPAETAPSAVPDPEGKADGYWNGSSFN